MEHEQSLSAYLEPSEYMNYNDENIQAQIKLLNQGTEMDRIRAAYHFVRDEIDHSYDIQSEEVTRTASEVLERKHGICYAKSHLLAALLRGMDIPAGIWYQRLTLYDKPEDGYCVMR